MSLIDLIMIEWRAGEDNPSQSCQKHFELQEVSLYRWPDVHFLKIS